MRTSLPAVARLATTTAVATAAGRRAAAVGARIVRSARAHPPLALASAAPAPATTPPLADRLAIGPEHVHRNFNELDGDVFMNLCGRGKRNKRDREPTNQRSHKPDFPPDLRTSCNISMVIPFSALLHMS